MKFIAIVAFVLSLVGGRALAQEDSGSDAYLSEYVIVPEARDYTVPTNKPTLCPLLSGYKAHYLNPSDRIFTYSFWKATSGQYPAAWNSALRAPEELSAGAKTAIRAIFGSILYSETGSGFQEVADTATTWGQIRIVKTNLPNSQWGSTSLPNGGQPHLNETLDIQLLKTRDVSYLTHPNGYQDAIPGTFAWQAFKHEIGHALGLKHPFETANGGGTTCLLSTQDPSGPNITQGPWPLPGGSDAPYCPYIFLLPGSSNYDRTTNTIMTYRRTEQCAPYPARFSSWRVLDKSALLWIYPL